MMAIEVNNNAVLASSGALSNTWRNRLVAFAPIAVALLGIGIMAATGPRDRDTLMAADGVDPVMTGSVAKEPLPLR